MPVVTRLRRSCQQQQEYQHNVEVKAFAGTHEHGELEPSTPARVGNGNLVTHIVTPDLASKSDDEFSQEETPRKRKLNKRTEGKSPKKQRDAQEPKSEKQVEREQSKAPKDWERIYSIVEELRQDKTAPCDSMGCEALALKDKNDLPGFRFVVLVSLLLSSQTKDAMVAEAIGLMKRDEILTVNALLQPEIDTRLLADKYLAKVGFRNNKAKYLKQVVEILHRDYNNDIPPTASQMMNLPGIGPKMAYLCEAVAWNPEIPSGIGVDTHMHRLFNLLGWVKSKTPEQTREQLESWLPTDKWKTVNLLWVGFGQEAQQEKSKILRKALDCSDPAYALRLLQRCGVDLKKEGKKYEIYDDIQAALKMRDPK